MTQQHDLQAEAATEPEPEVKPQVIQDLDVSSDDSDIAGGDGPIYAPPDYEGITAAKAGSAR